MNLTRILPVALLLMAAIIASGQKKTATLSGMVVDENDLPLSGVSIVFLGKTNKFITGDSGYFSIQCPADKAFALEFSKEKYVTNQKIFFLIEGETEKIIWKMERAAKELAEVIVKNKPQNTGLGQIVINPKYALQLPSTVGGVEGLIKILVGSNNELTSQYNVRGGSYDENLIYVNDFEIFRPYLIRNGQQEGLSFINSEMVKNIAFYNGGFQARYGDKMSSVLDIEYKTPKTFGGSVYASLLEQGLHLEGIMGKGKIAYIIGGRNRSNRNLLSSQETKGNYTPSSSDLQGLINIEINKKWSGQVLTNISSSVFSLSPASAQLSTSVLTPFLSQNLALNINFSGAEKDAYTTKFVGASFTNKLNTRLKLKWLCSYFSDYEKEQFDIAGAYLFGERDIESSSPAFGLIVNPLGAGIFQNYARNYLTLQNYNLQHKGFLNIKQNHIQWGLSYDKTIIHDKLHEWVRHDSAGYSTPYNPGAIRLHQSLKSDASLNINKYTAFIQNNLLLKDSVTVINAGIRINHNGLNGETIISPRVGVQIKPQWKKNFLFKASVGMYSQPPFYRELRRYNGTINTAVKAQKSLQGSLGFEHNFSAGGRRMRWTTEAFYKHLWHVVPYDIDNVRLRYFGENNAKAYAAGVEMRLYGELVKDAESWVSIGYLNTKENLEQDNYTKYIFDEEGQITDSMTVEKGWVRRPTDRRFTMGVFFQDYLATNKNIKVTLSLIYGSNLPYNLPGSIRHRGDVIIPEYIRADIGFSALLIDAEKSNRRSHNPFRNFDNIWASFEVFNLINKNNTISYLLIKDFSNNTFTVPQRLTPRLINLKIIARW